MTSKTKKIIAAILSGLATTVGLLGAGDAHILDPQVASMITAVISAILLAGTPLATKQG